jgi:hypothetical protein
MVSHGCINGNEHLMTILNFCSGEEGNGAGQSFRSLVAAVKPEVIAN